MTYPYYILPVIEEYKLKDPRSKEGRQLSRLIAANIGDLASLRLILGIDPPEFARFYPDMETATPTTMSTIDSFLDKYGVPDSPEAFPEIFVEKSSEKEESDDKMPETDLSDLIKERRYSEALAFIESQNLINPQKSIYFALQIRFIKKLMALEEFKKRNSGLE